VSNRVELIDLLQRAFGKKAAAYWLERLDEAGISCGPIQTVDQVVAHEQTRALVSSGRHKTVQLRLSACLSKKCGGTPPLFPVDYLVRREPSGS
jgi:crotonobetainyl-CoA:carnitine CoA-transferase CaiB-like acyl-CoA transferase